MRVADSIAASSSNDKKLPRVNDTDMIGSRRYQEVMNRATFEGNVKVSEEIDGKGVLYCELELEVQDNLSEQAEGTAEIIN